MTDLLAPDPVLFLLTLTPTMYQSLTFVIFLISHQSYEADILSPFYR